MPPILELSPEYQIPISAWIFAMLGAFLVGISKAGIKGIGIITVTLLALAFESQASTGIVLLLFMLGDIFAVIYYKRHVQWKYLMPMLPWMMLGVIIGNFVGKDLLPSTFKKAMAFIIIGSVVMMFLWEKQKVKRVPTQWWFAGIMGFMAGFTTMLGNLAGAFSNIYFLAMRLPKDQFIGTAAWLFFIINIFKLPFHIFSWGTVSVESLAVNLRLFPLVMIGFWAGLQIVERIKNQQYRKMILILTAIGAVLIFFK